LKRNGSGHFLRSTEGYVASTDSHCLARQIQTLTSHTTYLRYLHLPWLAFSISLSISFQVVLLGDTNTGKTSLVLRFVEGYYRDAGRSSTVGAFFLTKRLTASNITCKLLLWDTAGQEQFQKLAVTYYRHAAAAILSYDVTNPRSLVRLRAWLDDLQRHTGIVPVPHKNNSNHLGNNGGTGSGGGVSGNGGVSSHPIGIAAGRRQMVLAVVACKSDLPASPGLQEEAARLAASMGAIYIETSAKENINVGELFHAVSEQVLQTYQDSLAAGIAEPAIPVIVHGGVSHSSPTHGGGGSVSVPSPHMASMATGEFSPVSHAVENNTGQSQRSSTPNTNAHTNSNGNAPLSPMLQDEKNDDGLLNEAAFPSLDDNRDGSLSPNRISCDSIAGNILTCGATDTNQKCVIL
jgi:GTPase SAR1 family protein